jgi:hypothetical protein
MFPLRWLAIDFLHLDLDFGPAKQQSVVMNRHSEMIQDETFFPCEMFIFTEAPIQQKATGGVLGSRCDEECGNIKNPCTRVLDANKLPAANAQAMKIFYAFCFQILIFTCAWFSSRQQ